MCVCVYSMRIMVNMGEKKYDRDLTLHRAEKKIDLYKSGKKQYRLTIFLSFRASTL